MKSRQKSVLGQNFLADTGAQRRVVDALGASATGDVVEIGPGKAAITDLLVGRAARLLAIEVDPALAAWLRLRYSGMPHVEVLRADVLSVDFTSLARAPGRSLAVVGNLPYYITSPILGHLFAHEQGISRAVVMVQREVAERITARPGTRDYGLLSVLCQMHTQPELLFTLPPEAFTPPPEIHSAVVRLEFAPRWAELGVSPQPFRLFLEACFAQKRKTLNNNLRSAGYAPMSIAEALAAGSKLATARAEELSPPELAAIYRLLQP
jgi:16S rRNA (adenine1518-N6/adenine1519-N6)-dimethyltransferase